MGVKSTEAHKVLWYRKWCYHCRKRRMCTFYENASFVVYLCSECIESPEKFWII